MSDVVTRSLSTLLLALVVAAPMTAVESSPQPLRVGGDVKPPVVVAREHTPQFPEGAIMIGQTLLVAEYVVARDGTVRDVKILKAGGPIATKAYEQVLRKWRFLPGTRHGQPVEVIFNVTLNHSPIVQMGSILSACGVTLAFQRGWSMSSEKKSAGECTAEFRSPATTAPHSDVQLHFGSWSLERELKHAGVNARGKDFITADGTSVNEWEGHRYRTIVASKVPKECQNRATAPDCPSPTAVFGTKTRAVTLRTSSGTWNRELLRILRSARFNDDPHDGRLTSSW